MQKYVIIVAGGKGSRMGTATPKQFLELAGKPVLMYTIEKFAHTLPTAKLIIVLPEAEIPLWESLVKAHDFAIAHTTTAGGETRFHSVSNGLKLVERGGVVAIHDGVRPFVANEVIINSFETAEKTGNAIAAVSLKDSIRSISSSGSKAEDRSAFKLIQTPQTFRTDLILDAFNTAYQPFFTDDASVAEHAGHKVNLIEGNYENIKITTPEDLKVAQAFL
ncbi:2-C-methyl-D-erythritol 4-phosphate cytidylyltransferase [Limibacter armeniacum]|uniref:2-C-methyl-D-erythritol 4-phosphate cytidylyltransferase n=1 Tax=Limibacter armeniacum TaxID=466084 RepID=UPI002FE5D90A